MNQAKNRHAHWTPRYPIGMTKEGERDLLILGCSQKKDSKPGRAIDVYDGPLFRTARRRIPEANKPLDILIISSRHGIIREDELIEPYDDKLPRVYNPEFAKRVSAQLRKLLPPQLNSVLILAPRHYTANLPVEMVRLRSTHFEMFSGRMGRCQARLLKWLGIDHHGEPRKPNSLGPLSAFSSPLEVGMVQQATLRLATKSTSSNRVTQWYALIDDHHVPVKRLVAALTGAPVSSFETCHALALLHRNGIETSRVGAE